MYVSEKHRFVYFCPTKVASNTIAMIATNLFDASPMSPSDMEDNKDTLWPPHHHHSVFLPEKYKDFFLFASVRNPYEREISKYNFLTSLSDVEEVYRMIGEMTFENYIDWVCSEGLTGFWRHDMWKRTIKELLYDQPVRANCVPVDRVDGIVKCESMEEDFLSLPFVEPSEKLLKLLRSRNNFCSDPKITEFPQECVEKCYQHFKEDFDMFGYNKDDIPLYKSVQGDNETIDYNGREITTTLTCKEYNRITRRGFLI